jgi:hypothetical protein
MKSEEFAKLFDDPSSLPQSEFDRLWRLYYGLTEEERTDLMINTTDTQDVEGLSSRCYILDIMYRHRIPIRLHNRIQKILGGYSLGKEYSTFRVIKGPLKPKCDLEISSHFLEALSYLDIDQVISIFEGNELEQVLEKSNLCSVLLKQYPPILTLEELAKQTQRFFSIFQKNFEFAVATGYPKQAFGGYFYLWQLLPCYPTRHPVNINHNDPEKIDWIPDLMYLREYNINYRDIILAMEWSGDIEFEYQWPGNRYDKANLFEELTAKDEMFIESFRRKLHGLKIPILEKCLRAINRNDFSVIWPGTLDLLRPQFTQSEIEILIELDSLYGGYGHGLDGNSRPGQLTLFPGGLSAILLSIEIYMVAIVNPKELDLKAFINNLPFIKKPIESYFQIMNEPWREDFDRAFDQYFSLAGHKEARFLPGFAKTISSDISNAFDVTMQISPAYFDKMARIYGLLKAGKDFGFDVIPKALAKEEVIAPISYKRAEVFPFPVSVNRNWENISIAFQDGHTLKIHVGPEKRIYHYSQMGFQHKRSGKPIRAWELLEEIAQNSGILGPGGKKNRIRPKLSKSTEKDFSNGYFIDRVSLSDWRKKQKQILANMLKNFFQIDSDPFHSYKTEFGWKARFKISYF